MILKVVYEKLGGHYHCNVYSAKSMEHTFELCGKLVFRDYEWDDAKSQLFYSSLMEER